jgi:hypothetical protein
MGSQGFRWARALDVRFGARCGRKWDTASSPKSAMNAASFLLDHPHLAGRDGIHKKKGHLRCHKRPKSREETPKAGSNSEEDWIATA